MKTLGFKLFLYFWGFRVFAQIVWTCIQLTFMGKPNLILPYLQGCNKILAEGKRRQQAALALYKYQNQKGGN